MIVVLTTQNSLRLEWANICSTNIRSFHSESEVKVKLLSHVWLFVTPWTVAYQDPQSMGFSRQEYWSGLPFLLQGIFPTQGSNPGLPYFRQTLYCLSYQGSPRYHFTGVSPVAVYIQYSQFKTCNYLNLNSLKLSILRNSTPQLL